MQTSCFLNYIFFYRSVSKSNNVLFCLRERQFHLPNHSTTQSLTLLYPCSLCLTGQLYYWTMIVNTNSRSLKKIGLEGVNWTHLPQDRDLWLVFLSTVMNLPASFQMPFETTLESRRQASRRLTPRHGRQDGSPQ